MVSTSSTYHLGDALGSVRQLADAAGQVTLVKSYEPYGSVVSSAGSGVSMFGYTGEQQDSLVLPRMAEIILLEGSSRPFRGRAI